uniref:Uncharacterized protein n=1 Tax=Sphaerodactylus townsendi TaxID=933632 RepID=A0ACB8EE60_9SAUR
MHKFDIVLQFYARIPFLSFSPSHSGSLLYLYPAHFWPKVVVLLFFNHNLDCHHWIFCVGQVKAPQGWKNYEKPVAQQELELTGRCEDVRNARSLFPPSPPWKCPARKPSCSLCEEMECVSGRRG